MSAFRRVVLLCDHDIVQPCVIQLATSYGNSENARTAAESKGWKSYTQGRHTFDFCPDHDRPAPLTIEPTPEPLVYACAKCGSAAAEAANPTGLELCSFHAEQATL